MARWGVTGSKGANSVQTVIALNAAAANMRRAKLYECSFGCNAVPADNTFVHIVQRTSALGTGTAVTPAVLDLADTLPSTIVAENLVTVDPALVAGAIVLQRAINQRQTWTWQAPPYGEIIIPATASAGLIIGLSAPTVTTFADDAQYEEY